MQSWLLFVLPALICMLCGAAIAYFQVHRPAPIALGTGLAQFCVVSADEIREYCDRSEQKSGTAVHLRGEARRNDLKVVRKYIAQMKLNTKVIQKVARFEKLKIDPAKSSLDYETRETLALRLTDESAALRWLLVRSEISVTMWQCAFMLSKNETLSKLHQLLTEYKQLEQDLIAFVGMATEEAYYPMLVERLGLSGWSLIDGGGASPAS